MTNFLLSIILVNFNAYQYLDNCLQSIGKSDVVGFDIEIIVIDNESQFKSLNTIKKKYPQVNFIQNKNNVGFATANNQGIRIAHGKYILLLNPDTIITKNTLKKVLAYLDENPKVGIVTCKVNLFSGGIDDACHRGFPTPWNSFCQFIGLSKLFPRSNFFNGYHLGYKNLDKIHEIDCCAGAFMMIRRQAGEEIRWFDEDYFWYGEDIDFCFRVKKNGWKVIFLPTVSIIHYKGISSGIKSHTQKKTTATRNIRQLATASRFEVMRIFYIKHYQNLYPKLLMNLVFTGINILEKFVTFKNKY